MPTAASLAATFYFDDRVLAAQGRRRADRRPRRRRALTGMAAVFQTVIDERWARIRTLGDPLDDPFAGVPVGARDGAADRGLSAGLSHDRGAHQLEPVRVPDPGLGAAHLRRARRRAAVARPALRGAPRRARSGGCLGRPPRRARRAGEKARRSGDRPGCAFAAAGTDLFVPLHRDARWQPAWLTTSWGRRFLCNLPSEEIYVAPDFRGVSGTAVATRPVTVNGVLVSGLVVRFEDGRVVEVAADRQRRRRPRQHGTKTVAPAAWARWRWSMRRRGSGALGIVFKETLLDETRPATSPGAPPPTTRLPTGCPTTRPPSRRAASTSPTYIRTS